MGTTLGNDSIFRSLAARQNGAFTRQQVIAEGGSSRALERRSSSGAARRILPGTYIEGSRSHDPSPLTLGTAATLAYGPISGVSHQTCLDWYDVWNRAPKIIQATSAHHHRNPEVPWLELHRSDLLTTEDLTELNGCRTTSILRAILDVRFQLTGWQIAYIIREAVIKHRMSIQELRHAVTALAGAPFARRLEHGLHLFDAGCSGTRTRTEDEFLRLLLMYRFPIPTVATASVTGRLGIEPDFAWRDRMRTVELDGTPHQLPRATFVDPLNDERMAEAGWSVLRIRSIDVWHRPEYVMATVRRHLGLRV